VNRRQFVAGCVGLLLGGAASSTDDLEEAWELLSGESRAVTAADLDGVWLAGDRILRASETVPPAELLEALQLHLGVLETVHASSDSLKRQLLSIRGLGTVLAAQKLFQLGRPRDQIRHLDLAFDLSKEAGDLELRSIVLALRGREVWSSLEQDPAAADDRKALAYVEAAARILPRNADPQIRTHVRAGRAEFHAAVGDLGSCVVDLEAARELILRHGPFRSGSGLHAPHDLMELDAMAASCGALLGHPRMAQDGIDAAGRALEAMPAEWASWRATIMADEGAGYSRLGEADVAALRLLEALHLADRAGSKHNRARVANHRRRYLAGVSTASVRMLDEALGQGV